MKECVFLFQGFLKDFTKQIFQFDQIVTFNEVSKLPEQYNVVLELCRKSDKFI
jgi:hypothetical protein